MKLYRAEANEPKLNAQRNLAGRSHYVDDDTLRWHKSRILATQVVDNGLLFALIESCALDMHNSKRGFRHVVFDVYGGVISGEKLEEAHGSRAKAEKAMWQFLNSVDALKVTAEAIDRAERGYTQEISESRALLGQRAERAAQTL